MRYLTVKQVRELPPLSRSAVYALIADGHIPAIRVPTRQGAKGRLLVEKEGLLRYLDACRVAVEARNRPKSAKEILAQIRGEQRYD